MAKVTPVVGTKYVAVDNDDCFVYYADGSSYAFVSSTSAFPPKNRRYDSRKEAEKHIVYLNKLLKREIKNRTAYQLECPDPSALQGVIDDLKAKHFRVAVLTVT